jgi:TP901 family phage tail tape measure protein
MAIFIPLVTKFDATGANSAISKISQVGMAAAKAAAGGLAALGVVTVASVKAFADFDAEMNKSISIMGNVADSLRNDMSDAAREVAKTTTFSAKEAAEAYFFLASAGLDAKSSIEAMPKVAKFAQAGMFDMALATDLLTDAQSALGLTIRNDAIKNMENMVRVSDVLVKANTLANASVEQFSSALTNKAGAALRALGKDVEEGVAVLAAFADQGIKGEEAGTQLGIVLRDLTTKAIQNKSEFAAMGLSVFDATGEMRNLGDIVGNLETSLAGMSDETMKATLLQAGFSDKSLASLMALLGTSEAIKTYEAALYEAGGTTEEVSTKQLETLNAQLGIIKSAFVELGIEIGERLEPTITVLAGEVQKLLGEMVASPEFEMFIVELTLAMEELLPSLIELLPPLTELALQLVPLLIDLIPVLAWFLNAMTVTVEGLNGGFKNMSEETNRFFGIASDGVGAIDRISGAFKSFDVVMQNLADSIGKAFRAFLEFVGAQAAAPYVNIPKFGGPMAAGGPVSGGSSYLVGERGPEIFTPMSSGNITSNSALGGSTKITINVTAGMGANGPALGQAIVSAIKKYERTSGPVFASA